MESNVIEVDFSADGKQQVQTALKFFKHNKIQQTVHGIIKQGWHPSFAKAIVRHTLKTKGW